MSLPRYCLLVLLLHLLPMMESGASSLSLDRFTLAVGGYEVCLQGERITPYSPVCDGRRTLSANVLPDHLPNMNGVSIWITRDWQENWYSAREIEQDIIAKGYTPIFMFYWFGDEISPDFFRQQRQRYQADLDRFVRFLSKIKGEKWVILNPEFNQNGVESDPAFNDLLLSSIQTVRQLEDVKVSFCIGDFGDYSRITDLQNWQAFDPSIRRAVEAVDFISFQEMRAVTRNTTGQIRMTAERSLAFSRYLYTTYDKPTFLAYIAVSSLGPTGLARQAHVYRRLDELLPRFRKEAGLIGLNSFHLTDIPGHQGYFREAESFFGLIDRWGVGKPALRHFRHIGSKRAGAE